MRGRLKKTAEELRDMRPPAEDVRQPVEDVPADGIVPAAEAQDDVPSEPVKRSETGNVFGPNGEYLSG